ncbi:MAG: hypothetical protein JWN37_15, partial [Candidatus Nomurabacteria bacterium]|nr:hypothetical protein [Candidatus Nomurabacteria bacterium]
MQKAINSGRIPQDLGAANRSNTMKEVIVSFDGRYADSHPSTGWINLVSSFWLPDPIFRKVCSKDSKFLYKTPLYKHFPNTIKYLKQFAKENNCELQRVIFASLLP